MSPIINHFDLLNLDDTEFNRIGGDEVNKLLTESLKVINEVLPKITHLLKAENETGVSDSPVNDGV